MKRLTAFLPALAFTCLLVSAVPKDAAAQLDAAPFAGYCFGDGTSTCLVPELSLNVTRIRLNGPDQGTVDAGAVPVGAGYALLFGYDQWWAIGPAVHGIVDLSQAVPNKVEASLMLTLLRYGHVGVGWTRVGGENQLFGQLGLTLPIDVVTTAVADRKTKAVRAARAAAAAPPGQASGN